MTQTVNSEDILKALQKDPRYATMTSETYDILVPFILKAPEIFNQSLLYSKVDVISFLQAKIIFLNYCLQNGLAEKSTQLLIQSYEKVASALKNLAGNERVPEIPTAEVLEKKIKSALSALVGVYRVTIENLPSLQKLTANPQSTLLTSFGMTEATAHKVLTENITIADLLLLEPGAILINGNSKK